MGLAHQADEWNCISCETSSRNGRVCIACVTDVRGCRVSACSALVSVRFGGLPLIVAPPLLLLLLLLGDSDGLCPSGALCPPLALALRLRMPIAALSMFVVVPAFPLFQLVSQPLADIRPLPSTALGAAPVLRTRIAVRPRPAGALVRALVKRLGFVVDAADLALLPTQVLVVHRLVGPYYAAVRSRGGGGGGGAQTQDSRVGVGGWGSGGGRGECEGARWTRRGG